MSYQFGLCGDESKESYFKMNRENLRRGFQELGNSGRFESGVLDKIRDWIENTDPVSRNRINAYAIASSTGEGLGRIVPILLMGTTKGILNLHWDLHCPHCNMITDEFGSLSEASGESHCKMCNIDYSVDFKQRVSVTFSLPPEIEEFSAPPFCRPPASLKLIAEIGLPFGAEVGADFELGPGRYRYFCPITLTKGILEVEGESADEVQPLHIEQLEGGHYDVEYIHARPGRFHLEARNHAVPIAGVYIHEDRLTDEILPSQIEPRLSGLDLIHYPEFAEFFGGDTLSDRERLDVSTVTFLFTDISGSTAMYERLGDAKAYNIVRDHFEILIQSIETNGGRVVKTIGDAVMASFLKSEAALNGIFNAISEFQSYNGGREPEERITLRAGIHRGPAILVNLNNRIDYFGTTVNRAARYESLSGKNELTFSESILSESNTKKILINNGIHALRKRSVNIKGIEGVSTIYTLSLSPE